MTIFEKTTTKCQINLNSYKTPEAREKCIKCMTKAHHENLGCSTHQFCCMELGFSVIFVTSGASRNFQHLLFAYCSSNGKGLFTDIDGSWKLRIYMVLGYV